MERREIILSAEQVVLAVGEKAYGGAKRVSEFVLEDPSKLVAGVGALAVLIGIRALASGALGRRDKENEINERRREENEVKNQ